MSGRRHWPPHGLVAAAPRGPAPTAFASLASLRLQAVLQMKSQIFPT